MSLTDRAREARERAALTGDPYDDAYAAALTAAEDAAAREQLAGVGDVDLSAYAGADVFPDPATIADHGQPGTFAGWDDLPPGFTVADTSGG